MRIGIDLARVGPSSRGIGITAEYLANSLAQVFPNKVVAFIPNFAPIRAYARAYLKGLHIVCLNMPHRPTVDGRELWSQYVLPRFLENAKKVDVLLCPAFDVPLKWSGPKIAIVHDRIFEYGAQFHPLTDTHDQRWARVCALAAQHVIVPSRYIRSEIIHHWNLDPHNVTTVYWASAIPYRPFSRRWSKRRIRIELGLTKDFVLYIGSSRVRKNVAMLVKSFSTLSERYPSVDLVLRTDADESLLRLIDELSLSNRTHIIAYCSPDVKADLYAACECFVFPSKAEGFGIPPLEAMGCGAPVIALDVGPMPEILGDAAALVKDQADGSGLTIALDLFLRDSNVRKFFRDKGLEREREFSWNRTAQEVGKLLTRTYRGTS